MWLNGNICSCHSLWAPEMTMKAESEAQILDIRQSFTKIRIIVDEYELKSNSSKICQRKLQYKILREPIHRFQRWRLPIKMFPHINSLCCLLPSSIGWNHVSVVRLETALAHKQGALSFCIFCSSVTRISKFSECCMLITNVFAVRSLK
jgi:hypothetical protein